MNEMEADLISRARAGDDLAFAALLEPLIGPSGRLAYGMLQDRNEAEDVVQEAALKAWRKLNNLRGGSSFRPWFLGIVANQCRTVRRGKWWTVLRVGSDVAKDAPGAEAAVMRDADLRRAVLNLPAKERSALLLHYYLDLSIEEVANAQGISLAGAKSRVHRALKKLRPGLSASEVLA
jgi:RNA polymerase sigma-70 factor (ECF subfamily)